jgi:serine/threonine-protein kinase
MVVTDNNITQSASIVGTPGYMSPEQIRGEKTQQTDIFSTGIVCFELFTGRNPVLGEDVGTTINNILNFRLENISNEIAKLPLQVQPALNSMLQNNLASRAQSAVGVLKLLGVEVEINKPGVISLSKNRKKNSSIIFAVVLIIAAVGVVWYSGSFTKNLSSPVSPPKIINEPLTAVKDNSILKTGNLIKKEDVLSQTVKKDNIVTGMNPEKVKEENNNAVVRAGYLAVNCNPWAEVYVDNAKIDTTPVKDISLKPGKHLVKLVQPDYPPYVKTIDIVSGRTSVINVNFKELVGYLNCNIYPWGDVYINGKFMGTTPLQNKPIVLYPGTYQLIIKSANYSPVSKDITITAKQTTNFSLNFEEQNN